MSKIHKNSFLYKIPSDKIRQNRQTFYSLSRERVESMKIWFDRVQNIARFCKFARCRQFLIIDKFISALGTNEYECIKRATTENWTVKQLNKYFDVRKVRKKRTKSISSNQKNVNENQELLVEMMPSICEVVSRIFLNEFND